MQTRAIPASLMALSLLVDATVSAQEPETEGTAEAPARDEVEEKPERRERSTPTAGRLPVEDPTIHQERKETLLVPEERRDRTDDGRTPEEAGARDEAEAGEPTASGLPVEDPTIHEEADPFLVEEEPKKETDTKSSEDQADWGQPVKVAYGHQGGLLVSVNDWLFLALSGLVQARYVVNYRTKPPTDETTGEREKQVSQGFDVARARFQLGVGLTEFVALYMRIGVIAGGDFSFQRAFIDLKWKYFRLRAGLFMNELIAESLINPNDHLFNDYSILENVFTPGSSKGVMFTYLRKRFSINLGYSDGLRTGFSEFRSPARADFAVTLRTQFAWGERGLGGFNRLIARRGTPFGIRIGGAVHYQDGGRSEGTADVKLLLGTVDLSLRGNGWSALLSATTGQDGRGEPETSVQTYEVVTLGVSLMGGYFVLENLQLFGQYGVVMKPRIQGEPPPSAPGLPASDDLSAFHAFGVGCTFFVVPGHDNVKLSTDFQYFLGRELGSTVPSSQLNDIQPNDDGSQFFWRIQISTAF